MTSVNHTDGKMGSFFPTQQKKGGFFLFPQETASERIRRKELFGKIGVTLIAYSESKWGEKGER